MVNSDVKWKPINKTAALVISRAPDWAKPPMPKPVFVEAKQISQAQPSKTHKPRKRKEHRTMSKVAMNVDQYASGAEGIDNQNYVSEAGIRVSKVNGEIMFNRRDVEDLVIRKIHELPRLTSPQVKAAEDARQIVSELVQGLGAEMEKFDAQAKLHCEQIRGKRMTMVTEAAQITNALKEIRQFFLGSDYKEEITRLSEFVDLCERMMRLKESGFIDRIADTMLTLSIGKGDKQA